jgi:hypothetical protein
MVGMVIVGLISVIVGYLYLFRPENIIKLGRIGNRLVSTDHAFIRHRTLSGIVMLAAGLLIAYVGLNLL